MKLFILCICAEDNHRNQSRFNKKTLRAGSFFYGMRNEDKLLFSHPSPHADHAAESESGLEAIYSDKGIKAGSYLGPQPTLYSSH